MQNVGHETNTAPADTAASPLASQPAAPAVSGAAVRGLLSVSQVASRLGCCAWTVRKMISLPREHRDHLDAIRFLDRIGVEADTLDRWLARHRERGAA